MSHPEKCGELEGRREEATGGECLGVPTIADSKLQSVRSRTCKTDMIRLIMECHEEAVSSQATQLTATVVGVAMSTLAGEHNPRSVTTMQVSRARWKAEKMRQNRPGGREHLTKENVQRAVGLNLTSSWNGSRYRAS